MTVWFTSDLHLGHRPVTYIRRYGRWPEDKSDVTQDDIEWHDGMLAEKWDAVVRSNDVVWVLGDVIANSKHLSSALEWINIRPGSKHLIVGNHDPVHPMHREAHKWQRDYLQAFETVQMAAKRTVPLPNGGSRLVLLSHFPYSGDGVGKEDRCSQWRLPNQGYALLHGHVHSGDIVTYDFMKHDNPHIIQTTKQIHIGLDAWDFTPVALEKIGELL